MNGPGRPPSEIPLDRDLKKEKGGANQSMMLVREELPKAKG